MSQDPASSATGSAMKHFRSNGIGGIGGDVDMSGMSQRTGITGMNSSNS